MHAMTAVIAPDRRTAEDLLAPYGADLQPGDPFADRVEFDGDGLNLAARWDYRSPVADQPDNELNEFDGTDARAWLARPEAAGLPGLLDRIGWADTPAQRAAVRDAARAGDRVWFYDLHM
ncbi:hypothetical protein [Bifidobacterium myosotis]|uniref:Uncharacterized protein n=1 Tax=Bifidobacterium myosotis TaxID=1630166 RepID=A0A5M9ZFN2_9BIFI|nr:hypothetical protein [Bifidobacterium myosotis]KAA8825093.1 hypothetical protein EMO91_12760 [Bifidobacterium myosotis]